MFVDPKFNAQVKWPGKICRFFYFWLHFMMPECVSPFALTDYLLTKRTKGFKAILIGLSWEIEIILRFELSMNFTYF